MKKILSIALISLTVCSVSAQKANVEAAKKLAGKIDKVEEARALINEAKENPETKSDVNTYYIGGKIEYDAFDKAKAKQMIDPNSKDVNKLNMAQQLVNGYYNMIEVLPLDSLPNEKGEIKPKYSKDALKAINKHYEDYWNGAIEFYTNEQYYPQAFNAFYIHGSLPTSEYADKAVAATPDSVYNKSLFNAGVCAYSGKALKDAIKALKLARQNGTDNDQVYLYEIACWQNLEMNDSTLDETPKNEINEIASQAYEKFGMKNQFFITNLVNSMVADKKMDDAIALVNSQIDQTPDIAALYGLLGYIYDHKGDDNASVEAYKKAAATPGVDAENLKLVCKKLFRVGAEMFEKAAPGDKEAKTKIRTEYYEPAKAAALKAQELNPQTTGDLDEWISRIDYAMQYVQ